MAVELASGYVSLSVRLDGTTKGIGNLFSKAQSQATGAGKNTGEAYTKALESELKTAKEQVEKVTATVVKARDKEADAAGKLRVATEKLNEARDAGVKGSKLTQLETQRESALRRQTAAARELARETDALARSQDRAARAQAKIDSTPPKKSRFRDMFSGGGGDAEDAGAEAGRRYTSGFSKAMKAAGALAVGGSIIGGLRSVVSTGMDFEKTMNTLAGVTGASDAVMQKLRDTAKALGNDVTLSSTSAADAALAMTELAKAGFSVDDSMKAAHGTLSLAAAAQVDAAQAAEIQASALQAFGLNADYAGKAADVLANAANASSADIPDVAQAMQQAGVVANSFGVSLEDTSAAIALFANNGIKGSDAGTLLKTALQSLTDQGNPAQGAIEDLGLTVYNAQGEFVGLSSLFGQLEAASKRLSPEMYQAATATLFGSDAMRLASVASKDGSAGFDTMRAAIEKQGSAAELAAAQNRGWPGVVERIKNAIETLSISLFETSNPLQALGDRVSGVLDGLIGKVQDPAFRESAASIGNAIVSTVSVAANGFKDAIGLVIRFKDFLIPLVAGLAAYKTAVVVIGAVTKAWAAIQAVLNIALYANPIGLIVAAIAGLVAGIVLAYNKCETFRNIVNAAWNGIKTVISAVWNWLKTSVFPPMMTIFKTIGTVITAWWRNVVTPAFNGVKAVAGFMWEVVSDIFNNWKKAFQIAGTVAMALWNGAVKPAWDGIKSAFTAAWDFVSPIFDKFKGAWDGLKTGISAAAGAIKDAVTSAFSGLAGIIKAPLKVLGGFMASIPSSVMGFDIPGADKINEWGRNLQGLRRGGAVRDRSGFLSGPGTGTSDSIFGVNGSGVPIVRVADGEGVVRADVMARGGAAIVAMLNSGMLTGLAGGGTIEDAYRFAKAAGNGRPYDYGGVGPTGWDCSGFMSSIYAVLMGKDPNKRYFTTESDFAALGFEPGLAPGAFNIGIKRGGGGRNSHMAGTMPDGTNVESGGSHNSTAFGGPAAGAADFPLKFHLPLSGNPLGGVTGIGGGGYGSVSGGSGGGYSVGGKTISADTRDSRIGSKRESLAKAERDIEISKQELADTEAKGKASATQLERKRNSIADAQAKIDKLKTEIDELENAPFVEGQSKSGSGSGSSGSDPFSKILDGFGQLAQTGLDGLTETFLPEGFDNPMEWGALKAGGGLLNFFGSLATGSGNPVAGGILSAFGAGVTGDMQGVSSAIGGMLSPQEQLGVSAGDLSAASVDSGGVVPGVNGTGGTTYDQSISITNPTATDTVKTTLAAASNKQMGNFRSNFGTKPV